MVLRDHSEQPNLHGRPCNSSSRWTTARRLASRSLSRSARSRRVGAEHEVTARGVPAHADSAASRGPRPRGNKPPLVTVTRSGSLGREVEAFGRPFGSGLGSMCLGAASLYAGLVGLVRGVVVGLGAKGRRARRFPRLGRDRRRLIELGRGLRRGRAGRSGGGSDLRRRLGVVLDVWLHGRVLRGDHGGRARRDPFR
jgi:hypothetical protein